MASCTLSPLTSMRSDVAASIGRAAHGQLMGDDSSTPADGGPTVFLR